MTGPWTQHCWHRTTRYIASPATVARTLQQHRTTTPPSSILSIVLQQQQQQYSSVLTIDWAVASHPTAPAVPLERLVVERQERRIVLASTTLDTFVHTWRSHRVGGAIVAWPVTEEGRCGAECGRVLFVLDQCMEAVVQLLLVDASPEEQQTTTSHQEECGRLNRPLATAPGAAPLCCLQRIPTTTKENTNNTMLMGATNTSIRRNHPRDDAWGRNVAYSQGPPAGTERHVVGSSSAATHHPTATALWESFQREQYDRRPAAAASTTRRCVPPTPRPSSRGNLLQKIYRC